MNVFIDYFHRRIQSFSNWHLTVMITNVSVEHIFCSVNVFEINSYNK